jgi:hypothetical protein
MQLHADPRDPARVIAFGHVGDAYQHLFVAPGSRIVIVRMREPPDVDPVLFEASTMLDVAVAFDEPEPASR